MGGVPRGAKPPRKADGDRAGAVIGDVGDADVGAVVVDRAVGVVMAQMGMGAWDARACLFAEAAKAGRGVLEVAADLVERRLRMTTSGLVAD